MQQERAGGGASFQERLCAKKLIENMMTEADRYGFDGINLDFESLKTAAGVHYIEFIRELSVSCRKKGWCCRSITMFRRYITVSITRKSRATSQIM